MPESEKTIDLDRRLSVLEERMNTITESYDRGWKLLEAKRDAEFSKLREDNAKLEAKIGENNAKRDAEFSKLREDNAQFREDNARFREDIAKRDIANTRWLIAVITAATAIIIAVMAVLLSTS